MIIGIKYKTFLFVCMMVVLCLAAGCDEKRQTLRNTAEDAALIDSLLKGCDDTLSLQKIIRQYHQESNQMGLDKAYMSLGRKYRECNEFLKAIDAHTAGLKSAMAINDTTEIIKHLNNLGTNYRRLGILDEASTYHYQALSYCEKMKDTSRTAMKNKVMSLNGIGNVQLTLKNYGEAEKMFRASLEGECQLHSLLGQAINYANLGAIFEQQKQIDSAYLYYKRSLNINTEIDNEIGMSLCHIYLGHLYERENNWNKALSEYRQAYKIMEHSSDIWHKMEASFSLIKAYIKSGNLAWAEQFLNEVTPEIHKLNSVEYFITFYDLKYQLAYKRGDSKTALENFQLSNLYADSISSEESANNIQNVRVIYEKEKAAHKTNLLMEQNANQRKTHTIMILGVLTLFLVTVMLFSLYLHYIRRRNMQALKTAYNDLKAMNERVENAEKMKHTFMNNISHEIRTPLNAILGFSSMLLNEDTDEEMRAQFADEIAKATTNLTEQVNNLLDLSNYMTGEINIKSDHITAQKLLNEMAGIMKEKIPEGVEMRLEMPQETINLYTDKTHLSQVLYNLLSNACKNTTQGYIVLGVRKKPENKDKTEFYVQDTGCGVPENVEEAIFSGFFKTDSFKQGIGIGLKLSMLICKALGAILWYDKSYKNGARFFIEI